MGHLIRTLSGKADLDRLSDAYVVLAQAYLAHRAQITDRESIDFDSLRDRVLASEATVLVGELCKSECDLIDTEEERPVELYNNLGQIEVLIAAIIIMRSKGLTPTKSAPTQQSQDPEGNDVSDLEGDDWKLEAFGGQNCKSNQKIFEDLCTLKTSRTSEQRMFLGFREAAWTAAYRNKRLSESEPTPISGTTKKLRADFGNNKVKAQADLTLLGSHGLVYVCEVNNLKCVPSERNEGTDEEDV
jgi:hypothetical protein